MLKKLFISLIILSTLASEGIMNFPGNIYNILTCLNSDARLNINLKEKVEPSPKTEAKEVNYKSFKLTVNSLQKLGKAIDLKNYYKPITIINNEDLLLNKYFPSSSRIALKTIQKADKTIVLWRTDSSPPIL